MTTLDLSPDTSAALVSADRPPELSDERFVDVRPGVGASFDGSRYHVPIHVIGPAGNRRFYDSYQTAAIVSATKTHLWECDVVFLRLGNRVRVRDPWSAGTFEGIERRLAAAVRREGATLVTWTDAAPRPTDEDDYDVVVSR